jgi:CheY-like chemotaxis protein/GT2 family glycosyltransferase
MSTSSLKRTPPADAAALQISNLELAQPAGLPTTPRPEFRVVAPAQSDARATILTASGDRRLLACMAESLEYQSYRIVEAVDGHAALDLVRRCEPDIVVLDSEIGSLSGLEVCRRLRLFSDACVLMLAEWEAEEEKVLALTIGADDLLDKPFSPKELAARIRALFRRSRRAGVSAESPIDREGMMDDSTSIHPAHSERGDRRPSAPSISAVLPAYNEEALIEKAVRRVSGVLRDLIPDYEVIVVNDGSKDRTGEILAALRMAEPDLRLRVVTHSVNQGYGAALASGFDAATKVLIFMTDGDEQFDVAELAELLPAMDDDTDLVIGWRQDRADPPVRLFNAWGWKQLVNGLFGYTARDVDCAFKLFRREVWESLTVRARGATFSAELLIKARRLGFRVKELPVSHFPRTAGSATGARLDVIVRAFVELFRLRRHLEQELAEDPRAQHVPTRRHTTGSAHAA